MHLDTDTHIETIATAPESTNREISSCYHVIRVGLRLNNHTDRMLRHFFHGCDAFKVELGNLVSGRLNTLMSEKENAELAKELDTLTKKKRMSKEDKNHFSEMTKELRKPFKDNGLDKGGVYRLAKELRKSMTDSNKSALYSLVSQSIADAYVQGLSVIASGKGKYLHVPKWGCLDAISFKQEGNGCHLDIEKRTFSFRAWKKIDGKIKPFQLTLPIVVPRQSSASDELDDLQRKVMEYKVQGEDISTAYNPVRYCVIRRRRCQDHGKIIFRYELQILVEGSAPERKHRPVLGVGKAGIDPSTFTHAVVSDSYAGFFTPSPSMTKLQNKCAHLLRRMDAELRAKNESWFDEKGRWHRPDDEEVAKKGLVKSKLYRKLLHRLQYYWQRYTDTRLCLFHAEAKFVCALARVLFVEDMSYRGQQKRGHSEVLVTHRDENGNDVTESEEWTRRRFGRSILRGAPGLFLSILENTVKAAGGRFVKVSPWDIKASQYNPLTGAYNKHGLDERVIEVTPGIYIQRDLLAAYILKHCELVIDPEKAKSKAKKDESLAQETATDMVSEPRKNGRIRPRHERKEKSSETYQTNKLACREEFERFRQIHDDCIQYIVRHYDELPASVGLKNLKEIFLEKNCQDQRKTA